MKIESILKRPGGTRVHFGEVDDPTATYHFAPEPHTGAHVAEVEDAEHIQTFLSIREGYRIAAAPEPADAPPPPAGDIDLEALDKDALAALFEQSIGVKPPSTLSKAKIIEALRAQPEPKA